MLREREREREIESERVCARVREETVLRVREETVRVSGALLLDVHLSFSY